MRIKSPHPLFIICALAAMSCLFIAGTEAFTSADCTSDQASSDFCSTKNQVKVDASITYALAGLGFAVVGIGFQISGNEESAAAPPPRAPFPVAGGPPWQGNVPHGPVPTPPHPGQTPLPPGPPAGPQHPSSGQS